MSTPTGKAPPTYTPIPNARWNYWGHTIEGSFNIAGMAFIQAELVLPSLFRSLGASNLMIALSPVLMMIGFMGPPLFTAHIVERINHLKPVMLLFTALHRIPYFLIAATLYFFGSSHPQATLYISFFGILFIGAIFGCVIVGWMEYMGKTVEANRITSVMSIRNISGAIMGVFAGGFIKHILDTMESPQGYGVLFFITGCFGLVSYAFFAFIKEPHTPPKKESQHRGSLLTTLKIAPALFKKHPRMRKLLWSRLAYSGVFILTPFMGIHAIDTAGKEASFLGVLVTWQMFGSILGNVFAGYWGDKLGPKTPLMVSNVAFLIFFAGLFLNTSTFGFQILFTLFGFAFYTNMASRLSMDLEVCGTDRRPIFMSVMTFLTLIGILLASVISATLRDISSTTLKPAIIIASIAILISTYFLARIKNPRYARQH